MNKTILSAALLAMSLSAHAGAATIVDWDLSGAPGNQAVTAASSVAANIAGMDMSRGAGLGASAAGNSFSASGWSGQASDYFSFGFTVDSGYSVDLSNLTIATRSSNTGPGSVGLYSSLDGFTTALYTFSQAPGSNYVNSIVDLSVLQDLTGSVEFRLAQIGSAAANGGATGGAGTFRISEYNDNGNYLNVAFAGDVNAVAAVPEPETYAMMLAGLGLVGFMINRRKTVA